MRLLVTGWINVPHSYAIVNCFQLIHLYKNYKNCLTIYIKEAEYYRKEWGNKKTLVYPEHYNKILGEFQIYNGQEVDIVYNITYEYDITKVTLPKVVPKCVFYTAEFSSLDNTYFCVNSESTTSTTGYIKSGFSNIQDVKCYLNENTEIYFTTPSEWSFSAMTKLSLENRTRVITHGVDTDIFKFDNGSRKSIRRHYNIKDDEILLLNIGAMTGNKGILQIITVLYNLIRNGITTYKLLLKGTADLYTSREFLQQYISSINQYITAEELELLLQHIIFVDNTLSYSRINDLFNASDLYISPYLAEGFGLTVLESVTSTLPVLVPVTGSTKEYINNIYSKFQEYIIYLKSEVIQIGEKSQNSYEIQDLLNLLVNNQSHLQNMKLNRKENKQLTEFIENNYSWNYVSKLLYNYLNDIIMR